MYRYEGMKRDPGLVLVLCYLALQPFLKRRRNSLALLEDEKEEEGEEWDIFGEGGYEKTENVGKMVCLRLFGLVRNCGYVALC